MWKTRVKDALWHFTPAVLVMLALLLWIRFGKQTPNYVQAPGAVTVAQEPKVVEKIKRVFVQGPERIVYLDKPNLSAKLKMPEINREPGEPIAVATIPKHSGPTTAVAMLDKGSGETRILTRKEPTPFFEMKRDFSLQGRYLFAGENMIESDIVVNPLRIGPVEVEAGAGLEVRRDDSSIGARGWIGVSYKF